MSVMWFILGAVFGAWLLAVADLAADSWRDRKRRRVGAAEQETQG